MRGDVLDIPRGINMSVERCKKTKSSQDGVLACSRVFWREVTFASFYPIQCLIKQCRILHFLERGDLSHYLLIRRIHIVPITDMQQ